MDKTIDINGKKLKLKVDGSTPMLFNMASGGKDYFAEIVKVEKGLLTDQENVNTMPLYELIHVMSKQADEDTPDMMEFYASFEEGFPLYDVWDVVIDLCLKNIKHPKQKKTKK